MEKVPVKRTALGIPLVPLPVMVKVPPAAKVPPMSSDPLCRAPVENSRLPRLSPVMMVPNRPVTAVKVEPDKANPLSVPVRVPPELEKSTWVAEAASGRASKRVTNRRILRSGIGAPKFSILPQREEPSNGPVTDLRARTGGHYDAAPVRGG